MALIGSQSWVEGNSLSPWRTWLLASSVEQKSFSPPLLDPAAARVQLLDGLKPRKGRRRCNPRSGDVEQSQLGWRRTSAMEHSAPQTPPTRVSPLLLRGNAGASAAKIYQRWKLEPPWCLSGAGLRLPRCAELSRVRAARSQLARLGCRREGAGWEREEVTWGRTRAGATPKEMRLPTLLVARETKCPMITGFFFFFF